MHKRLKEEKPEEEQTIFDRIDLKSMFSSTEV